MAEPASKAPPMAGVLEPGVLLATKLHVPRSRPGHVARPLLMGRLAEGIESSRLVLVSSPAGFGKTTLLAEWAWTGERPVAWLSLDDGDNDPARFWRHATTALDRVRPGIADRVTPLLGPPSPVSFEGLVTALINELADAAETVVLVVDDYHLVQAPEVHQSLQLLLEYLPPSLRLVIASRADPPLPLARWRARGQLAEFREADLRFTLEEAAALLGSVAGAELPASAVTALEDRTEGWVAGLQLAAISLQDHHDPAGFVEGFSGSHRYVLDYLAEEVLDHQPEPLRGFLLETSVLERLSGGLCDATTGRTDSQQLLEQIERVNLFLVPLDEVRGWWRYHQLFTELLRVRLRQERPERVAELHRAAAAWYERHGMVDDAVGHARAAGDPGWVARLIECHFEAMLGRSEDATLRRWLETLPVEVAGSRPRLLLAQAFWALIGSRVEAVERLLDAAERASADAGGEPYEPSVGRSASLVANMPAAIAQMRAAVAQLRGDPDQTVAFARLSLAALDEGEWMLTSITRWYLIVAEWLAGRPAAAERGFASSRSSIAAWRANGEPTLVAWGYYYLGRVQRARGHLSAALATYQETLEAVAGEPGRPAMPAAGVAYVGMAEVDYERDELDSALEHANRGVALARRLGWTLPLASGLSILARIRQAKGDPAGALEAIHEAENVQLSDAVVGLLNPAPAWRARLDLANGRAEAAARWTRQRDLAPDDPPSYPRECDYLVLARVLLAQQAPEQALAMLERWTDLATTQERTESIVELRALQALAHAAREDEPAALAALTEALALGAPAGYLRVFVDEGLPMAAVFRRLLASQHLERTMDAQAVPREYLALLAVAFERAGAPIRTPTRRGTLVVPGLIDPLSERELQVLGLLADGRSNKAIAEELFISLDTVKRHVSHVLDKLGAANRTQAVARARELKVLP
jgi:LuxR family transcriptional regulator, maltose regulon positive regulatory protein